MACYRTHFVRKSGTNTLKLAMSGDYYSNILLKVGAEVNLPKIGTMIDFPNKGENQIFISGWVLVYF